MRTTKIINKRTLSWCTNKFSEPIMKGMCNYYSRELIFWGWHWMDCLIYTLVSRLLFLWFNEGEHWQWGFDKWSSLPLRSASFAFLSKIRESRFHRFLPHTNLRNTSTLSPSLGLQSVFRARRFSIGTICRTICACDVQWIIQILSCCSFKGRERRLHFIVTAHWWRGSLRSNVILAFWRHPEQA